MSSKIWVLAGVLALAVPAAAQTQPPPAADQTRGIDADRFEGRDHVGTSSVGDIGLFFVPTADTNGRNRWRGSAARTSRNGVQGQLNVADFTASFSYGLANRADVFVSWDAVQRVDRDISPLFDPADSRGGGIDGAAPYARDTWSGNRRADIRIGGKVKVIDELSGAPVSFALRGVGRLPTGDAEDGGGVGAPRFGGEGILSRWVSTRVVLTGSVGAEQRNNPDSPTLAQVPPMMTWGTGVGYLPAETILLHAELFGEHPLKRDFTNLDQALVAVDGSLSPLQNQVDSHRALATGVTWMARNGFFLGAAAKFDFPTLERANRSSFSDYTDLQVRLGWRPGPRRGMAIAEAAPPPAAAAPPVVAPAPAPAPAPAQRLPPLLRPPPPASSCSKTSTSTSIATRCGPKRFASSTRL